jgi:hypothetical protein
MLSLRGGWLRCAFFVENLTSDLKTEAFSAFLKSENIFRRKKEDGMGKLVVGLVRILPLCAMLLLLPSLAASQPAPLQPGLYTGITSQVTGCDFSSHPSTTCEVRFNIAATLDRLSPSPRVDEVISANARCPEGTGAEFLFGARCGNTKVVTIRCPLSTPLTITNGHWERHAMLSSGVSFDIVADCAGQTCAGTYSNSRPSTSTSPACQTGTLTWSATATDRALATASALTMEQAPVDGEVEWIDIEVDDSGVTRIIMIPDESK